MTAPLRLADGTASFPSLSFNSAVGSGFFKTANGFGVAVNGAQIGEFTSGGLTKGVRYIGELIHWTGLSLPARCVFPVGQTLSRTTYPDLWAFAQGEIAAGNLFYNNGDGSTTFGVGDLRGRTMSAPDTLGGSADAGRLINGNMSGRLNVGGAGGEAAHQMVTAELPPYTPSGTIANGAITASNSFGGVGVTGGGTGIAGGPGNQISSVGITVTQAVSTFSGNAQGGTSAPHNTIQPTILCSCILFAGA
jgi:microcystin-dependent protein